MTILIVLLMLLNNVQKIAWLQVQQLNELVSPLSTQGEHLLNVGNEHQERLCVLYSQVLWRILSPGLSVPALWSVRWWKTPPPAVQ